MISLPHLFFKKIIAQKPLLLLFISLLLFSCFLSYLFFSPHVLSRGSDGRGPYTSSREMSEGSGENGHQGLKRRSPVGAFWAWQSTKENALADNFRPVLAEIVCFLWLSDLCVTQTARGTSASECLSSSPHVFSLSLFIVTLFMFTLPSSTRGKKLLERFGNLWRWSWTWRIKWSVSKIKGRSCQKKKLVESNSMTWKKKQANWQMESPRLSSSTKSTWVTAHTKPKLISDSAWAKNQSNDTEGKNLPNHWCEVDAPLQCFGMEIDSLKEDEVWFKKRWWSVGLMEEHGWRNRHEETPNENYGRDQTEVWPIELFNVPMVLLKVVQELVVVPQIQCTAVCDGKTSSLNLECSETVEVPQTAIQRKGGQCPCRGAEAFFPPFKKKKILIESSREPCEEPDCMCSENCVVWTSTWA